MKNVTDFLQKMSSNRVATAKATKHDVMQGTEHDVMLNYFQLPKCLMKEVIIILYYHSS